MSHGEYAITMSPDALDRLMPMHCMIDGTGHLHGLGSTLRKFASDGAKSLDEMFENGRSASGSDVLAVVLRAARNGDRLFLRPCHMRDICLRGHAMELGSGQIIINLGFGIDLVRAVSRAMLTDRDFAPPELAMELLFMREAMHGALGELSRFNQQLDMAREMAQLQAHTDPLTGLRNRRGLEMALKSAFASAKLNETPGFALAHIDLDHFKLVNDMLGHAAGDELLCQVGRVLVQATRGHDTVARFGGDEFILVLRDLTDVATLKRLARRIIAAIEGLTEPINSCAVSASIGIVLSPGYRELSAERMLLDVDAALYQSKREGRGRVTIYAKPLADCI
ncbi:diguanylate cyclase domain-containing protein [Paracoccus seriniphilus]|uniref:diguanylate cyclase domain-containing protein n=1 Tax=Paracoccus seriniphilus TaxID=184748 RepID=UPI003566CFDF